MTTKTQDPLSRVLGNLKSQTNEELRGNITSITANNTQLIETECFLGKVYTAPFKELPESPPIPKQQHKYFKRLEIDCGIYGLLPAEDDDSSSQDTPDSTTIDESITISEPQDPVSKKVKNLVSQEDVYKDLKLELSYAKSNNTEIVKTVCFFGQGCLNVFELFTEKPSFPTSDKHYFDGTEALCNISFGLSFDQVEYDSPQEEFILPEETALTGERSSDDENDL